MCKHVYSYTHMTCVVNNILPKNHFNLVEKLRLQEKINMVFGSHLVVPFRFHNQALFDGTTFIFISKQDHFVVNMIEISQTK